MSLTPGWTEEDNFLKNVRMYSDECLPGMIVKSPNFYVIDQGSEYKKFPRTKEGWHDLLRALEDFEP